MSCRSLFLAGTEISLENNSTSPIEKVKVGDIVVSYNESSGQLELVPVLQTFKHRVDQYLLINNELKVTSNHPLYVNGQWLEAGQIKIGDQLLKQDGQLLAVSSVQIKTGDFFVYNLEVDKNHNYFAQKYLAHNKGECVPTGPIVCNWGPCVDGIQSGFCGNNCGGSAQTQSCTVPRCGDAHIDAGEECDDGNTVSGDGCSASCQTEVGCGNGQLNAGEQCDDGNTNSGDCCSASCQVELIISNVSVLPANNSATVNWQTLCQASTSILDWGVTSAVGDGTASGLSGQNYTYNITGLNPNTVYYYRITASAGALQEIHTGSFTTTGGTEICNNGIDDNHNGRCDYSASICTDGSTPGDAACHCTPNFSCSHGDCEPNNKWIMTCIDQSVPKCQLDYSYEQECGCSLSCGVCQHADAACTLCLSDPAPCCGNGTCEAPAETASNCPADCGVACISDWDCTGWEPQTCPLSGIQTRECFDRRACLIPTNPPPTQQSCSPQCPGLSCGSCQQINIAQCLCEQLVPCCGNGICETGETNGTCQKDCVPICLPSWTCSVWGDCINGVSKRQCNDLNNCNLNLDRPPEVRSCNPQCVAACSSCQQLNLANCICAPITPCCGNHICEDSENVSSCPVDCGLAPGTRVPLVQCLDGIDNDSDSLVDYPADLGCKTPAGNSELDLGERIKNISKIIKEKVLDNPVIQKTNTQVAAPALVTAVVVNTFASFSFFNFLTYLQFFVSQPLAALFRRRRQKWGTVYNSLTKQPVDLAIVRLYQKDNNRLVQSRVTDKSGRYNILASSGYYYLTVTKPKYVFPTVFLKNEKEDVKYLDLYHGQTFEVTDKNADIILNIPIDPKEEIKPAVKIIFQHYLRKVQYAAAFSAVPLATVSMVLSPGPLTFSLFALHCFLYILFRRLGYHKPAKNWGRIYDRSNNKSIAQAIVRVYDKKYNKLLETRVTDLSGRYTFLVNDNIYYITAEKLGYQSYKSADIDLVHTQREKIIGLDIGLAKATGQVLPPVSGAATPVGPVVENTPAPAVPISPINQPDKPAPIVNKPVDIGVGRDSLATFLKAKEIKEPQAANSDLTKEDSLVQAPKPVTPDLPPSDGQVKTKPTEPQKEPSQPPEKSIFG
ncbi:MAG: polymorphic toxin-type HINT domain-containing protein [Patescibacteria group bacterium]